MDRNYFGITDTGRVRSNNEDTFIAEEISGTDFIIACAIDGVGGYTGGEVAAAIARKAILEKLSMPVGDLALLMREAIADANEQILLEKKQQKELEDMACVLTLALIDLGKNQFYYAHVGDTRLYLLRDRSLIKISKDQSFVGFMEDSGRLTEEQAMKHPKRNEINKALGFLSNITAQEDYIETGHSPFLPGDLLLLCSDGLSDMVNRHDITEILLEDADLDKKGLQLINEANANGGLDNITAVIVKHNKVPLKHEATKPQQTKLSPLPDKKTELPILPADTPIAAENLGQPNTTPLPQPKQKERNIWLIILGVAIIAAIALYFYVGRPSESDIQVVPASPIETRSPEQIKLQDTLDKLNGNILVLSDTMFKAPVVISEPLQIRRDSLYIKAEHQLILTSDSLYTGEPLIIATSNKSILLENINFRNFKSTNSLVQKGVLLKNVTINSPDSVKVPTKR
jgi:serine/threonine protein phosphatase PrpC